jgi:hypothetical protein
MLGTSQLQPGVAHTPSMTAAAFFNDRYALGLVSVCLFYFFCLLLLLEAQWDALVLAF